MVQYCRKCGEKLDDDSEFCQHCGFKLNENPVNTKIKKHDRENKPSKSLTEKNEFLGKLPPILAIIAIVVSVAE